MAAASKKNKFKINPVAPPVASPPSLSKKTIFLSLALLVVVGLAVYANALSGKLLWDDETLIVENPYIQNVKYLPKVLCEPIGAGTGRADSYYRPVQMASYMLDYAVWRLNPFGFHLTSALLHVLAGICFWWLSVTLFGSLRLALWAGLLFTVHPIHTEAVAYVAGRADSLVAIFSLLCCIFYVARFKKPTAVTYVLMLLSFLLALLARENSLVFPAILLLLHYISQKKFRPLDWFSLLACGVVFSVARLSLLPTTISHTVIDTPLGVRLCGFFVALARYVRLMLFPYPLHMEYAKEAFSMAHPEAWFGLVLLIGSGYIIFSRRKNDRFSVFCLGWFFIALLPFANIYPIKTYMAEHWLYMPSMGIFLLMAKGLMSLGERFKKKNIGIYALAALLTIYSVLTVRQNTFWKSAIDLFTMTMRYSPRSLQAYVNLGLAWGRAGNEDKAKYYYEEALKLNDNSAEAHNNLANIYLRRGLYEEAIRHGRRAIAVEPRYAQAYYNLGNVYVAMERPQEAVELFGKAIRMLPDTVWPYNNLGVQYYQLGQKDIAIQLFKKIIEIKPDYAPAYNNLANVYKDLKKLDEAIGLYQKTLELDPGFFMAYYNLGLMYQASGRLSEALGMFRKALKFNPGYEAAEKSLAEVSAALQNPRE
jgi:tetratricopeptide (TPR) repeat protein